MRRAGQDRSGSAAEAGELNALAQRLGDLARSLQDQRDVDETLQGMVDAAVDTVPGAAHAGVSVVRARRSMRTVAASTDLVNAVDQAQIDNGQGPCLDVLYLRHTVSLPDMAQERRWPRFAAQAVELGVGSMMSFQLYVTGDDLGALNLYAHQAHAFTAESERVGLLFAAHAGVALADAQEIAGLRRALDNRDLIGQAKGILIERYKITSDQAFALLTRASQHTNTKLVEVARFLVTGGEPADRR